MWVARRARGLVILGAGGGGGCETWCTLTVRACILQPSGFSFGSRVQGSNGQEGFDGSGVGVGAVRGLWLLGP